MNPDPIMRHSRQPVAVWQIPYLCVPIAREMAANGERPDAIAHIARSINQRVSAARPYQTHVPTHGSKYNAPLMSIYQHR